MAASQANRHIQVVAQLQSGPAARKPLEQKQELQHLPLLWAMCWRTSARLRLGLLP